MRRSVLLRRCGVVAIRCFMSFLGSCVSVVLCLGVAAFLRFCVCCVSRLSVMFVSVSRCVFVFCVSLCLVFLRCCVL